MAKSTGIEKRQGSLNKRVWSCSHQQLLKHQQSTHNYYLSGAHTHGGNVIQPSLLFKRKKYIEYRDTCAKAISVLQKNIFRILEDCLHTDLYIIHQATALEINSCIFSARAPNLYNHLRDKYFKNDCAPFECNLDSSEIFHQINGFVRLLYCNLDITEQEQRLVEYILYIEDRVLPLNGSIELERSCLETSCDVADLTVSRSEMADSGLETGSFSPHENTESENSCTDLEESHVTDYVSTDEDLIKVSYSGDGEKSLSGKNTNASHSHHTGWCSSGSDRDPINNQRTILSDVCACGANKPSAHEKLPPAATANSYQKKSPSPDTPDPVEVQVPAKQYQVDEVAQYENEVLNDPFYESDNEQSDSFVVTGSFEFIEPANLSPTGNAIRQEFLNESPEEKSKSRSMIVEPSNHTCSSSSLFLHATDDFNLKKSSTSDSNNYYFIDASSLNDDNEIASNLTKAASEASSVPASGISLPTYLKDTVYIPSKSHEHGYGLELTRGDNNYNNNTRKSFAGGQETTAEFQCELKLTEYLSNDSPSQSRRIRAVEFEKSSNIKPVEKESLVVEIKEADSGESNHPSPCIDNNKKAQCNSAVNISEVPGDSDEKEDIIVINENLSDNNSSCDSQPLSLVRGNTFELESGDEKLSHLRQEYERRQGNLVFKSSIPQYSGHRVDDDLASLNGTPYSSLSSYFSEPAREKNIDNAAKTRQNNNYSFAENSRAFNSVNNNNNDCVDCQFDGTSNGLHPLAKSASDKLISAGSETDDSSINDCNSLPSTFDHFALSSQSNTMRRTKRDEMTPIVSGGVSSADYSRPTDSPSVRRKTESTPIVSGGSVLSNFPNERVRTSRMSSSMTKTSWVVDMSNCGRNNVNNNSPNGNNNSNSNNNNNNDGTKSTNGSSPSSMSQSYSYSESPKSFTRSKDKQSFFVNLKDINCGKDKPGVDITLPETSKDTGASTTKSCEFFIDLSNESDKTPKNSKKDLSPKSKAVVDNVEKKNIFSMFIDLSEPNSSSNSGSKKNEDSVTSKDKKSYKLLNRMTDSAKSSSNESPSESSRSKDKKQSVFMFIESDSPVVRRRTLSTSRSALQRHSWNVADKSQSPGNGIVAKGTTDEATSFYRQHKRAHSVSIEPLPGVDKLLLANPSGSSVSLNQLERGSSLPAKPTSLDKASVSVTTSFEGYDNGIRDTPPNSHVEIINDSLRGCVRRQEYKDLMRSSMCSSAGASVDPKIFDDDQSEVSQSQSQSVWDKTGTESTTGTEGHTRKSETFDISSGSASGPSRGSENQEFELGEFRTGSALNDRRSVEVPSKIAETHKSLTETIKKIECEFNKPEYCEPVKKSDTGSGFVRLSDLDKVPPKSEASDVEARNINMPYRMCSSIPEMSWVESKLAVNRTNGPCQVRTLSSRKFTSIMSTSLPAKHKSPIEEFANEYEVEGIVSESDLSSMQSSMGRSGADVSTEETETSSFANTKPYNRLGEDLLRMFLEEINPDVTIDVSGRRIRAHKCILSSRCQYFAAILSGGWIESAGNVISLQGYSYSSVHFALCHIYSGESNIPDSISIVELATLADMLCLEGLKEVIGYTIKVKYCHLFHKPCQICAVGVLECLPLAAAYGLDEVYRKSLRWITRHFVRIWPCKAFAALPRELIDKCYHQHIVHMSADNILQTIMDCDKLLATLPNVRWAEPVFRMVSNLLETALKFLSENFTSVLSNESFQALGRDLTWNISRLEDSVLAAADRLPPDQACKSYAKLAKMMAAVKTDEAITKPPWGALFVDFLGKIQGRVEKCLVKEASRASRTTTWMKMDLELRRRIQELACLVILPHESLKRPSRHSNFLKDSKTPPSRTSASRSLDLRRVKMTMTEANKAAAKPTVIAQTRKILPKPKSDPLERKMQDSKLLAAESTIRPKSWPNKLEVVILFVKSRYLEPRNKSVSKDTAQQLPERVTVQQRRKIMISSSDSSRTSSPAMKRAVEKKPITKLKAAVKKDMRAVSSDSLTDTSAKPSAKRDNTSKSCGITRPESPSLEPKDAEIGLSADSLADSKKKPLTVKKIEKMDTSMSADSLMTEVTATPKSVVSNKVSPTLGRPTAKSLAMERAKKSSPPVQHKSPLGVTRRPVRSVESSTAASRNRVAAINAYHGSPNLRRNLLDAAKTPEVLVPSKLVNGTASKVNTRQSLPSTSTPPASKREKKDSNPSSSDSPSKRSPKSNSSGGGGGGGGIGNRVNRNSQAAKTTKTVVKGTEEKNKLKCHNVDALKQLTVGSRSGTFLKDEPTILKKSDMKTTQVTS
ncbi:GSCOCG00002220001-RA-CDS [Cotesia congregata]|nr:GSCOCG00002220001-RA-CDS [Cotesia congregata]